MIPSLFTPRLELRPATVAALRADLEGHRALAAALGAAVPASWPPEFYDADAVRWTIDHLGDRADGDPWGAYYVLLGDDGAGATLAGMGGFKGEPDDERGEVELGYGVATEYRRRRIATEAVGGLTAFAFADARVRTVVAHTLTELAGSIGVLERAGFRFAGAGTDPHAPEGAAVIRYELTRAVYEHRARRPAASPSSA